MAITKRQARKAGILNSFTQTKTAECIDVNGSGYHYNSQTGQCEAD